MGHTKVNCLAYDKVPYQGHTTSCHDMSRSCHDKHPIKQLNSLYLVHFEF